MDFIRANAMWLLLAMLMALYVWIIIAAKAREARVSAYIARSQADSDEYKRHNAAVEQKLDRIIELLESRADPDPQVRTS